MAILSETDLQAMRRHMCLNYSVQGWTKADINAALQALENRMTLQSTLDLLASDIESAAPGKFNSDQKFKILGIWCISAAQRLGVL